MGRVLYAGAKEPLTVRADSGFYTHAVVAVCRKTKVRFSITIRQRASRRNLIEAIPVEAIPEEDWTPIPYWMDGAADDAADKHTLRLIACSPYGEVDCRGSPLPLEGEKRGHIDAVPRLI